jgi:hypothetical protein
MLNCYYRVNSWTWCWIVKWSLFQIFATRNDWLIMTVNVILIILLLRMLCFFPLRGSGSHIHIRKGTLLRNWHIVRRRKARSSAAKKETGRVHVRSLWERYSPLKKIENKRTYMRAHKKLFSGTMSGDGGSCNALRLTSQLCCNLIGQERLKFRWRMRP